MIVEEKIYYFAKRVLATEIHAYVKLKILQLESVRNILKAIVWVTLIKDDSSLVQLFIMLHRPVNFEISAVACTSQQANLKKQWSMKYYKQLNGKAIIFIQKKFKTFPRNSGPK